MADTNGAQGAGQRGTHEVGRSGSPTPRLNSEILDRLPPQSLEAERGVLGSLLLRPAALRRSGAAAARADDFYADANQRLYRHLFALHDEGKRIDITLLIERLKQSGEYEAIGGGGVSGRGGMQSVPYAHNAPHYAEIVRNKATVRELIHAATEILRDAWDPGYEPKELLSQAEERIFSVHDRRSNDRITHIQDLLIEAFDRIDARLARGKGDAVAYALYRSGQLDRRPAPLGVHRSGRAAQHGQDGAGHEHRGKRRHSCPACRCSS